MPTFTEDNTDGYTNDELQELNSVYDSIIHTQSEVLSRLTDSIRINYQDLIAERVLLFHDSGLRGDALLRKVKGIL